MTSTGATHVDAVLLTGAFGVGKSTVAADMAAVLEAGGVRYGALDLDWLAWTNANGETRADFVEMMVANLRSVSARFVAAGATRLILAGSIRDRDELARVGGALDRATLRTVELIVPLATIEHRLANDPTEERRTDLANTAAWLADGLGTGFADRTMHNDGPVREISVSIARWLGWLET